MRFKKSPFKKKDTVIFVLADCWIDSSVSVSCKTMSKKTIFIAHPSTQEKIVKMAEIINSIHTHLCFLVRSPMFDFFWSTTDSHTKTLRKSIDVRFC